MKEIIRREDPTRAKKLEAFDRLLTIMDELRDNCPWDKVQTNETLRHLTLEEVYELSEAILSGNSDEIKKEVGDVLLHLVFYARIGSESNQFDIESVINSLCDKLVSRHPHIYADVDANDSETVKKNWEALKLKEGSKSVLAGVPKGLPAMVKAMRIQEKARGAGFDWDNADQVWEKVQEEMGEFLTEVNSPNSSQESKTGEFGDLLFSLINYARFQNINPDEALEKTNAKFIKRFKFMEERTESLGLKLQEMSLDQMEEIWQEAKSKV